MVKLQMKMDSVVGPLYLVASSDALHGIFWKKQNTPMLEDSDSDEKEFLKKAAVQIEEYLNGKRKTFDLPIDAEGTEFQKRVWNELRKIPYGETRTYKDIAMSLKDPNACRAVGTANGKNPISIIVPCHRVINVGGKLGGYAGGLEIKKKLLSLENGAGI